MTSISAKSRQELAVWYLIIGVAFSLSAVYFFIYDKKISEAGAWLQVAMGLIWIVQGIYFLRWHKIHISWDEERLELKLPGRKKVFYETEEIKNLTLTKKHFIVNAGLADGEMIDLKYFIKEDKEKLKERFWDYNANRQLV